jgi:hypothetical protein
MTRNPTFELLPLDRLRPHEAIDEVAVGVIIADLHHRRVFREPIWVARGSNVILDGHHRWAAMRAIGARRIPAWVFDYINDDTIHLDRWTPGEPISKSEVLKAGESGRLFPRKTTRHILATELPHRDFPLTELMDGAPAPSEPPSHSPAQR